MRVIVGLILVLGLQLCVAQQTSPAGLSSVLTNVLVWSSSWRLSANVSSVSSWDTYGHAITTAGSAPTLLANQFNGAVPGVNFSGSQCLSSNAISTPSSSAYSIYVVAKLPGVGVHVLAAQEQASSVGYSLILSLNGTAIELGFYVDGALLGSVVTESAIYTTGDAMIFWYSQDASYGTIGFDTVYNSFASDSTTFNAAVTTSVGCNQAGDHLTGVIGEVLILKSGGNNTAVHNIVMNSLAARFGVTGIPNMIYTGATDQNGNCNEDVSGIGAEASGAVPSGNSAQLTVSRLTALPDGDYIMFGRVPDDGDLFALPFNVNFTRFSRSWFFTVSVQGQATADVSFDVSTVKDVMAASNGSYILLLQANSSTPYQIIAENGVVSSDNDTVSFDAVTLSTGFVTIGSTASLPQAPHAPQAPTSGPVAGPAAGPAAAPTYAYPSPGIVRRSDATAATAFVIGAVVLAASLLF